MTGSRRIAVGTLALSLAAVAAVPAESLRLAEDGATTYRIVRPEDGTPVDDYAAENLARYMQQITGAEFPIVAPAGVGVGRPAIFIGLSKPASRRLGEDDLLADLEHQEHVTRSKGADIFLYGEGIHGNLHPVMAFLEEKLEWRWYSVYEHPVLPSRPTKQRKGPR